MRIRKVIAGAIAISMIFCVTGCKKSDTDSSSSKAESESKEYEAVKSAVDALRNFDEDYIVTNVYSLPSGTDYYLEVKTADGTYREYPVVDEESDTGMTAEEAADTTYALYDWVTTDNKAYLINPSYDESDAASTYWVSAPDDYGTALSQRKVLFMDTFLEASSDWKSEEDMSIDLGAGEVTLDVYSCTVSSDSVAEVLGVDSLGMYKALKKRADANDDENMVSLTNLYIDNLSRSLTFSEGILTVGVYDGMIRYFELEAGGLGSTMYLTKTVMQQSDFEVRALPDFSSTSAYYDTAKELADYVAKYDSYEEALAALNEENANSAGTLQAGEVIIDEEGDSSEAVEEESSAEEE